MSETNLRPPPNDEMFELTAQAEKEFSEAVMFLTDDQVKSLAQMLDSINSRMANGSTPSAALTEFVSDETSASCLFLLAAGGFIFVSKKHLEKSGGAE